VCAKLTVSSESEQVLYRKQQNRRFTSMKKVYNIPFEVSKSKNNHLYKIFTGVRMDKSFIHNLAPQIKIPFFISAILSLGLKFSFPLQPNFKLIRESIFEAIRKLCWSAHFHDQKSEITNINQALIKIMKDVNRNKAKKHCHLEDELFPDQCEWVEGIIRTLQQQCRAPDPIYRHLLKQFRDFQVQNKLIIIQADKNAGICIMNQEDYKIEVLRQLEDLNTYHPTTKSYFELRMEYLRDEIRTFSTRFPDKLKLKSLIPSEYRAANFYVLPKVHKSFTGIPKGRPISSTINTLNRGVSRILDSILQPVMNFVPDIVLDSAHLLLLLKNVKLNPNRKYMLVTADIEGLYTNLKIQNCKNYTCEFFEKYKNLIKMPFDITSSEIRRLMNWSLDYSFVEFGSEYFYQHRGIQMGNNASVSIANITVYNELCGLYKNCLNLEFKARFIDDIFMIVDVTDVSDPEQWCRQTFVHNYLNFTYIHSSKSVDFLDLTISLDNNNCITTALYKKPINKHQFLHYGSAHPKHLLNSLPYSSFLRVIRSCSDLEVRKSELEILISKFKSRSYPESIIQNCLEKVKHFTQSSLLVPKKPLLISNLRIHNPDVLSKFNICIGVNTSAFSNRMFIIMPFYKNVLGMGKIIRTKFTEHCKSRSFRKYIEDMHVSIAYKQTNSLQRFIRN